MRQGDGGDNDIAQSALSFRQYSQAYIIDTGHAVLHNSLQLTWSNQTGVQKWMIPIFLFTKCLKNKYIQMLYMNKHKMIAKEK